MSKTKKKKSGSKKATKKKVKFNKGTPYEMDYVWTEPKELNMFSKIWNWIKTQF